MLFVIDSSTSGDVAKAGGALAVSGLPAYWELADAAAETEWEDWWYLFMVAVNAKQLISERNIRASDGKQTPKCSTHQKRE